MTHLKFFADTSFLIGYFDDSDNFSDDAMSIFTRLTELGFVSGLNGFFFTDYIIVEMFHFLQDKIGFTQTLKDYQMIKECQIYRVKQKDVDIAVESKLKPFCNHRTRKPKIGLVDATSLVIMDKFNIPYIISSDIGFDSIPMCKRIGETSHIEEKIPEFYF